MKIRIFVNPSRLRRWHILLADRLMACAHTVAFAFAEGGPTLPLSLELCLRLERLAFRGCRRSVAKRLNFDFFAGLTRNLPDPDLIIDLTVTCAGAASIEGTAAANLQLLFDGNPSEIFAVSAMTRRRHPVLAVVMLNGSLPDLYRAALIGRPLTRGETLLGRSLDLSFQRAIALLVKAVALIELGEPLPERWAAGPAGPVEAGNLAILRYELPRLACACFRSLASLRPWRRGS